MKAIIQTKYGRPELFSVAELARPVAGDDDVLVAVHAAAVNYSTTAFALGKPFLARLMSGGIFKPKFPVPGAEIAGTVAAVGTNVKRFRPGDAVYADLSSCGRGGYAEYVVVPETALALKPANFNFAEAAAVPEAAVVALQGLREAGNIQPGQQVLILGASGGIGTFAVQLARHFGAEVTAVCGPNNVEMVRSLGAAHVVDYTREDFSRRGESYDLILAVRGSRAVGDFKRALKPGGACVVAGGSISQIFRVMLLGPFATGQGRRFKSLIITLDRSNLVYLRELAEAGAYRPVIERCFPLDRAAEAVRYYAGGHARGRVIINVKED